ncbi:MAG: hypothetical protein QME46_06235 [Thermoanaerobacteraceae bacterium]|nr:hypothetical protein [Thermoanaerobacteraceae bacterium]
MGFNDVLGADHIFEIFKNEASFSNVYIITGERGAGKGLAAREIAKYLNCTGGNRPCDTCRNCKSIEAGSFPDVYMLTQNRSIGVDEIRDIIEKSIVRPYTSRYNVFIINKAHTMTSEAQNAILKTLEECHGDNIFLLLADSTDALLPTIRSRAQVLSMRRANEEELTDMLMKRYNIDKQKALFAARFSKGVVGKAVMLLEPDHIEFRQKVFDIIDRLRNAKPYDVFDMYGILKPDRETAGDMLDIMESFYRDLLMINHDKYEFIINADKQSYLLNYSGFPDDRLVHIIERIEEMRRFVAFNSNIQLTFDVLFLDILGV